VFRKSLPPTAAGEIVPGYRALRPVGRGGFSVVYRAYQEQLHREVALKVLSVEFVDAPVRRRFLREVKLTSRLAGHPHVVTVLDSGLTNTGRPYLAMEYFERGSLRDRLASEGPLPVTDVLRIGIKICGALAAAHAEGFLHRDVKPQNILISRYGEPALADFGTARLTDAMDVSARTEALTPFHAAPEVLQGRPPTPACDIYSLSSALFQALTGKPPYQSDEGGIAALLLRILRDEPPPVARADVPAALVAVLHRALAKEPADRYPSAVDFAEALQGVQAAMGLAPTELGDTARPSPSVPAVEPSPAVAAIPALPDGDAGTVATAADPPDPTTVPVRHGRWPVVVGVLALVLLAAAVPLAVDLVKGVPKPAALSGPGPASAAASGSPSPFPSVAPVAAPDPVALRPYSVTYIDGGSSVALHWQVPVGAERYNVLVQYAPHPGAGPTILNAGLTSYTASGLDPATGYCFSIGLLLALGHDTVPPVESWSVPACIRGAIANPR
jgi:tRNA A-37 threonylcarbamoyl transferase component Bud32